MPAPTCIKIPPMNGGQTLTLVIPFRPVGNDFVQDLLCPIHPHLSTSDRCIDLLSCNRFSETVYVKSITICKTVNSDSSWEMCFQNVTEEMNGTKLHFFYADLQCSPNGIPESSRTYTKSVQLITEGESIVIIIIASNPFLINFTDNFINHTNNDSKICIESNCDMISFKVSIVDVFGCITYESQSITNATCVPYEILPAVYVACAPYFLEIEAYDKNTYRRLMMDSEILGNQ